ncbi:nuclease-related domain-containing protein [Ruminococcus sp. XPD3002]|uniref:nuclease-related domain-containing protein n=1 Tax=Ruminococcus sp. XPD3002 TaxID=1452269 RepID=UPI0009104E79|nr:Nuclease-related domain-containing protein [Ruminococcus flavefaciens]
MKYEKRVNEILSQITAFSNVSYTKREVLSESLKLQKELADLVFNNGREITEKEGVNKGISSDKSDTYNNPNNKYEKNYLQAIFDELDEDDKRYWHIIDEIRNRYSRCNSIPYHEFKKVEKGFKDIINDTRGLISGIRGEEICHQALNDISCQHEVLYNVELEYDGIRKEIDAIVITNNCIFLIEVKNSKKNVFIDEKGNFIRNGKNLHCDGNIARKIDEREMLLRKALEKTGLSDLKIFKILAFSNQGIDVENKYRYIKVCSCKVLPYFIDKFTSDRWYTHDDINAMMAAITEARCSEEYRMSINMDEFKKDFANLLVLLENPEETKSETKIAKTGDKAIGKNRDSVTHIDRVNKNKKAVASVIGVAFASAAFDGLRFALGKRIALRN